MAIELEHKIPKDYFEADMKEVVAAIAELQEIVGQMDPPEEEEPSP